MERKSVLKAAKSGDILYDSDDSCSGLILVASGQLRAFYMSEGGRHSCFYTRTEKGLQELKRLMMEPLTYNPVQFLSSASIKLFCTDILDKKQKTEMFLSLKASATKFMNLAQGILDDEYTPKDFYQNIILNNTICELKNIITIIENFEKE